MDNSDTDNTGHTTHRTKVSENRRGNQVSTIQTPKTLGIQYTEQRLAKTEGAIKNEQSRHRQHWVNNTHSKGQRNPNWQSSIDNPDTDNIRYTIHRTTVRENEVAINYGYSNNRQHRVLNKDQRKPKGQSGMNNPDTYNTGYSIHRTKVSENRRGNQE